MPFYLAFLGGPDNRRPFGSAEFSEFLYTQKGVSHAPDLVELCKSGY